MRYGSTLFVILANRHTFKIFRNLSTDQASKTIRLYLHYIPIYKTTTCTQEHTLSFKRDLKRYKDSKRRRTVNTEGGETDLEKNELQDISETKYTHQHLF